MGILIRYMIAEDLTQNLNSCLQQLLANMPQRLTLPADSLSEMLKICLPLLPLFCSVPIHYWSSVNGKTSEANYPIDMYIYSPLYYDLHLAFQGVSQSHYFQTERTSLPPAPGLHQRMMRSRVEKMMPAMEVGKTLRRRKMSEEVMLPARHFKTKMKLHKKMSFQSKFPA